MEELCCERKVGRDEIDAVDIGLWIFGAASPGVRAREKDVNCVSRRSLARQDISSNFALCTVHALMGILQTL